MNSHFETPHNRPNITKEEIFKELDRARQKKALLLREIEFYEQIQGKDSKDTARIETILKDTRVLLADAELSIKKHSVSLAEIDGSIAG